MWTIQPPPDTTDPETFVDSGPPETTLSSSATLYFSADEAANFKCSLNGCSFNQCASPFTRSSNLTVGSYTFQVFATDSSGNVDDTPASYSWSVVSPVDTTITEMPIDPTDATSATFSFTADQAGATFECALDLAIEVDTWTACAPGVTYTGLAVGEHELAVRAKVNPENVDPTPARFSWEIGDITPPVITITDGPGDGTGATVENEHTATFTFTADPPLEFGTSFQCTLSGGLPRACSSPYTVERRRPRRRERRRPVR